MRIRVLRDRDLTPPEERRLTIAYRAGMELTVKRTWGEALVSAGAAEEIVPPSRHSEVGEPLKATQSRGDAVEVAEPARRKGKADAEA